MAEKDFFGYSKKNSREKETERYLLKNHKLFAEIERQTDR